MTDAAGSGLSIELADVVDFSDRMATAPKTVSDEIRKGVNRITTKGSRYAQDQLEANESVVTGNLRRSIFPNPAVEASGVVTGEYGPHGVDYAAAVEDGRRALEAQPGKALGPMKFRLAGPVLQGAPTLRGAGGAFFKRVRAAAPKPYMKPSLVKLEAEIPREFQQIGANIVKRLRKS